MYSDTQQTVGMKTHMFRLMYMLWNCRIHKSIDGTEYIQHFFYIGNKAEERKREADREINKWIETERREIEGGKTQVIVFYWMRLNKYKVDTKSKQKKYVEFECDCVNDIKKDGMQILSKVKEKAHQRQKTSQF